MPLYHTPRRRLRHPHPLRPAEADAARRHDAGRRHDLTQLAHQASTAPDGSVLFRGEDLLRLTPVGRIAEIISFHED